MPTDIEQPLEAQGDTPSTWIWATLLTALLALALLHWALPHGVLGSVVITTASLLAALAVLAAWRARPDLYRPRAWLLLGLALLTSFIGHLAWYSQDLSGSTAYPLLPNLAYMLTYGLLIVALWVYSRQVESRDGAVLDSLMIVVAAAVVFWALMVDPFADIARDAPLQLVVSLVYPLADLLLLTFVLKLFFLSAERSVALMLIIAAVATVLVADLVHAHGVNTGWYAPGGFLDVLWLTVYALMAAAAWHPSASQALVDRPSVPEHPFARLLVIGAVAIAVPTMILIMAGSNHALVRIGALASIVIFALMQVRTTLLLRCNKLQAEELEHRVRTDSLTGAANRRLLEERLELEMARAERNGLPLTIAFLDLDHFKRYNDRHGHRAGDAMLKTTVECWQRQVRGTDLLARIGGEEFVLVCPNTGLDDCTRLLQRLQAVIPDDQTCSAGVTAWTSGDGFDSVLQRADEGLYQAKRQGRDQIVSQ